MKNNNPFLIENSELVEKAEMMLKIATSNGINDASVETSENNGFSVTVRKSHIETIEKTSEKNAIVTIFNGFRKGVAQTSNFSETAMNDTVLKAIEIAKYTAEDKFSGLPDSEDLEFHPKKIPLFFPWQLTPEQAIDIALEAEDAAFSASPEIKNSDGSSLSTSHGHFHLMNTKGFSGGYSYSRHTLSVAPISHYKNFMERDFWYTTARDPKTLASPKKVGQFAAKRALSRLGSKKISTRRVPVLFDAPIVSSLLGSFVQAVSGNSLYKNLSFLNKSLGTRVFSSHVQILEDPFESGAIGSAPFDAEGVKVRKRNIVVDGILKEYFLSSYSAKRLKLRTTGNAGGSHNLKIFSKKTSPSDNLDEMLSKLNRGLFVTELMGQGVNSVTGDYSKGAAGFWVERGKIAFPVSEITIAGNLKNIFKNIVAIGSDQCLRGNKCSGSMLISEMTIAGT